MNVDYREFCGEAEISPQRILHCKAFPEQEGQVEASELHYRWKFRSYPSSPPSYEYGGYVGTQMVGYYAALPFRYKIAGQERVFGMVCDVMTDPAFQGKGIFTGLGRYSVAQMKAKGLDCLTGFPIRPSVLPGHLRVGWKVAFELPMYLRPLRPSAILKSKSLGFLSPFIYPLLKGINFVLRRTSAGGEYSVHLHSGSSFARNSGIQTFLEAFAAGIPNYMKKNLRFYEWRLGAPEHDYSGIELQREGRCVGLAIGRRTILHNIPVVAILDMMVLPQYKDGLPLLHSTLESLAVSSKAEALVTMMSKHSAAEYQLRRHFYLKSPFIFKLILNSLRPSLDEESLFDPKNWHLMWIDSDDL